MYGPYFMKDKLYFDTGVFLLHGCCLTRSAILFQRSGVLLDTCPVTMVSLDLLSDTAGEAPSLLPGIASQANGKANMLTPISNLKICVLSTDLAVKGKGGCSQLGRMGLPN